MLAYMRKNANSFVVWLIIGAIALVFIFWGVGGGGGSSELIKVGGEEVSLQDYDHLVQAEIWAQQQEFNGDPPPSAERLARFRAVNQLVSQILIRQFGYSLGLIPSDQVVARNVAANPTFQEGGRFSLKTYTNLLATQRLSARDYENSLRDEIIAERVAAFITSFTRVYPPEALEMFHFQEDQVKFSYIFFPSASFRRKLVPRKEDLEGYYVLNQEKWRLPSKMTVEYVEIRQADFQAQAQPAEQSLLEYYNENPDRFQIPESIDVSQILFKFPNLNPNEAEKKNTLERAEAAYVRSRVENFADLARILSDDPLTAAQGGEMGVITRGTTFNPFEEAAFEAPLGEVSRPVATNLGYHLIKVNAYLKLGLRPFAEVKNIIAAELTTTKAREMAVSRLEELITRAETNPNLADAAKSLDLTAVISPAFTKASPLAFFENNQSAVKRAFEAPLGKVAPPVEGSESLVLYTPLTRVESRIPSFSDVRDSVVEAWLADESDRLVKIWAQETADKIRTQGWTSFVNGPEGTAFRSGDTGLTTRSALIGVAPFNQVEAMELFTAFHSVATVGEITPELVAGELDGQSGRFLLKLDEYQAADEMRFQDSTGHAFQTMMSVNKANLMNQIWRAELYEVSKNNIVIPERFIK
ncbi:MAG: hypothetical protein AMR96_04700 [Candidatus Adiutrix intracellularis]|nr:MAG: hypothetical protein AMR96_04700 [Candidatus Adiutrix intracellularis]